MTYGILSDREIEALCRNERPMLSPFINEQAGRPSYGLSSFGYDLRLGRRLLVPLGGVNAVLDPIDFPTDHFRAIESDGPFELSPNSQVLAESVERFDMPDDVCAVCWGRVPTPGAGCWSM